MVEPYRSSEAPDSGTDSTYTYGDLCQKSPEYLEKEWTKLGDLYIGGWQMIQSAEKYLPKMIGERYDRYQERLRSASYINHMAQIIDEFACNVFSQEISVTPAVDDSDESTPGEPPKQPEFYSEFQKDADLNGTSLDQILRGVFTNCILNKRAILAIDLPNPEVEEEIFRIEPSNLADEEALGLDRAYVFEIPVASLYDFRLEGPNHLEWAVFHKKVSDRKRPGQRVELYTEQFKIWYMDEVEGVAKWEIWSTEPHKVGTKVSDKEVLKKISSGDTSFKAIPILFMEVPESLWVGNRLGPLALEYFQRRSTLYSAENRSLFALPYVKLGEEIGAPGDAIPSEVQQDPHRGDKGPMQALIDKGYMVLGKDDSVQFAEPLGTCYEIIDKQLTQLVDEMFRITHHMSSSVAASKGMYRSAKSKVEDRHAMEIVLSAFGAIVRNFVKRLFDFVSSIRGESIIWHPHGMDTYELEDRELLVKEATFVDSMNIPSPTFKKAHKTKVAFALVGNVPTETKTIIRQEISDGVDEDNQHLEKQEELQNLILDEQLKDPGVVAGTKPPPMAANKTKGPVGLGITARGLKGQPDSGGPIQPADSVTHHPHRARNQTKGAL